eukprot:scaffold290839_cov51-Prasinocladus_malaysianus.AAC.1
MRLRRRAASFLANRIVMLIAAIVMRRNYSAVDRCFQVDHVLKGRKVELKRAVPKDQLYGRGGGGPGGGMKVRAAVLYLPHAVRYCCGGFRAVETDWKCLSCGNVNFGWREKCNRCA